MDDLADIFKQSLREEGLDAKVTHSVNHARMADVFRVTKEINGEKVHIESVFTFEEQLREDKIKQRIAYDAARVARSFDEYLTERVQWGQNCVRFDMKDGYSATCFRCGAEVCMSDLNQQNTTMAETAVPQPTSYTSFDNLPEAKIRMTLHALLLDECDDLCPNSAVERDRKI